MRLRPLLSALLLPSIVSAWQCEDVSAGKAQYDLGRLSGQRHTSQTTETPPTTVEARVKMNLCGKVDREGNDEDQCPDGTHICLQLVNHKESASEKERVTAVIPLWKEDTPDQDIRISTLGQGLRLDIKSDDYAGSAQSVHLSLLCDTSATDPNPTLLSYTGGRLELEWKTPDACALSANPGGGGLGLWSFLKFMFWFGIVGLIGYLILGSLYNQQQYGARGWDLVPHRDFWRELPTLVADLGGHLFQNVRTSTGRGGYSSLG